MSTDMRNGQNNSLQNGVASNEIKNLESKLDAYMEKLIEFRDYVTINFQILTTDLNEIRSDVGKLREQKCEDAINNANAFAKETDHVNITGHSYNKFLCNQGLAVPGSSNQANNNNVTNKWKWREEDTFMNSYFPQVGDSVVFCKKIHLNYLTKVQRNKLYSTDSVKDKTMMRINGENDLFVQVKRIVYDPMIQGLCEIELEYLKENNSSSNTENFTVRYHKSAIYSGTNFLVLRQIYDDAPGKWKPNDKFRRAIDGKWHFGEVLHVNQYLKNEVLTVKMNSTNCKITVRPWEIEPIDERRLTESLSETIPILSNEIKPFHYKSQPDDWPLGVGSPNEILQHLEELENDYGHIYIYFRLYGDSLYTASVAYPIDLKIIKSRLESGFYRRFKALRLDVDYLMKNIIDIRSKNIHPSKCSKEEYGELFKSNAPFHKIIIESDHNIKDLFAKLSLGVEESQENSSQNKPLIESHVSLKSESSAIKDNRRNKNLPGWANDCLCLLDRMQGCVGSVAEYEYSRDDKEHVRREIADLQLRLIQINSISLKKFLHDVEHSLNQIKICDKLVGELKKLFENGRTEMFSKYNIPKQSNPSKTDANLSTSTTRHANNADHDSTTLQKKINLNRNSNIIDPSTSKTKRTVDSDCDSMPPQKKLKPIENNNVIDNSSANGTNKEINDLQQASTSKASPKTVGSDSNKDWKDSNSAKNAIKGCDANIQVSNKAQRELTETPKKPAKDKPKSPIFTSKEYLQSVTPNQIISREIIGKVFDVIPFANHTKNLLTFCLEFSEDTFIKINVWGNERDKIIDIIKKHQILSIQNLHVGKESKFTKGNIPYDLTVKTNTAIRRWTRAQKWELFK